MHVYRRVNSAGWRARRALRSAAARALGKRFLAACFRRDASAALLLVSEGANLDFIDFDGECVLHWAICFAVACTHKHRMTPTTLTARELRQSEGSIFA